MYRFADEYNPLKNTKPPVGQAITDAAQALLFTIAKSKPQWIFAYVAATLDFFCGLRACEIKGLQWKHINFDARRLSVRRSKTPAGWRDPSLNDSCLEALRELHGRADALARVRRTGALPLPLAWTRQEIGPGTADDLMAERLAIVAEGSRPRARPFP